MPDKLTQRRYFLHQFAMFTRRVRHLAENLWYFVIRSRAEGSGQLALHWKQNGNRSSSPNRVHHGDFSPNRVHHGDFKTIHKVDVRTLMSVTTPAIFPDFPVAPLVRELGTDVEGEEEERRPLGPRVHQAVGEDGPLGTIHG